MTRNRFLLLALALVLALPSVGRAQSLAGLWDAAVVVGDVTVPFRMEIAGAGSSVTGSFFNGDQKVTSTTGSFENGALVLSFDEYETKIEATLKDGRLEGQYTRGTRGAP